MNEKDSLLHQAEELSLLIKDTLIYREFTECRELLNRDQEATELVNRLVSLGKEISENMNLGEDSSQETLTELEDLKAGFNDNEIAHKYMESQKNYLGLLDEVIKRIINPEDE